MTAEILCGDAPDVLAGLPAGIVQTCVTSPPYWGLRDYQVPARVWGGEPGCRHQWGPGERVRHAEMLAAGESRSEGRIGADQRRSRAGLAGGGCCRRCGAWRGCLGLERSPDLYVSHLVEVLDGVRRVLREDGTLWLVLGDTYAAARTYQTGDRKGRAGIYRGAAVVPAGVKAKDLLGLPWAVAFALRARGWWLRAEVIWAKPNPMPESVRDRPTRAYEHVFLLAKQRRYFYDPDAVRERDCGHRSGNGYVRNQRLSYTGGSGARGQQDQWRPGGGRNRRDVWTISPRAGYQGHIAAFPEQLIEPCVLAGSSPTACRVCGAPWQRVVHADGETTTQRARRRGHTRRPASTPGGQRQSLDLRGAHTSLPTWRRRIVGWQPTCDHGRDDPGRCLVLDPFCGSGTSGVVAARHGRDFLGIELNPAYAETARQRLQTEQESGR